MKSLLNRYEDINQQNPTTEDALRAVVNYVNANKKI